MRKIKCTLAADINTCPFYIEEDSKCMREEPCNFGKEEIASMPCKREERWYEKYYKNTRRKS